MPWFPVKAARPTRREYQGQSASLVPLTEEEQVWLRLVVTGLNHLYSLHGRCKRLQVLQGPQAKNQQDAMRHLAAEVRTFLHQNDGTIEKVYWQCDLSERAVSYSGEEVFTAEPLCLERLLPALPPEEACAAVDAAGASAGFVKACLEDPLLTLKPETEVEKMPRIPRIWASQADWEEIACALFQRGLLEPIEWDAIAVFRGKKVLGGFFLE